MSIKQEIVNSYMRGFHHGAGGGAPSVRSKFNAKSATSFERGFEAGQAALTIAKHAAERYADELVRSTLDTEPPTVVR